MLKNATDQLCTHEDHQFFLSVLLIIGGWSSTITCVLGLLGNVFSLVVLQHKKMRTLSTNTYLFALAIANLLWLLLFLVFFSVRFLIQVPYLMSIDDRIQHRIYDQFFYRLSPYVIPLMNTLQLCIIYFTVAVSIDRYFHVSMYVNVSHLCTVRNARRTIAVLTLFAILFISPYWFQYRVLRLKPPYNGTYYKLALNELGQNDLFRQIVHVYLFIPIVHLIPFIVLIVSNLLTVHRLIKYKRHHQRLLGKPAEHRSLIRQNLIYARRHYHTTVMLIAIVILFFLCRCPMLITKIYEVYYSRRTNLVFNDRLWFRCRIQRTFSTFANFLQTLNSNGNLIIYFLFYPNFRIISKRLMNKRRFQHKHKPTLFELHRPRMNTHSTDL